MVVRLEEGIVILVAWLKLGFLGTSVGSVDLWIMWMETVLGLLQALWRILDPRVYRGIVAIGIGWSVLVTVTNHQRTSQNYPKGRHDLRT